MSLRAYDKLYYPGTLVRKVGASSDRHQKAAASHADSANNPDATVLSTPVKEVLQPPPPSSASASATVSAQVLAVSSPVQEGHAAVPPPPAAPASSGMWEVLFQDGQHERVDAANIVHPQRLATEQRVLAPRTPGGYPEHGTIVGHEDMAGGHQENYRVLFDRGGMALCEQGEVLVKSIEPAQRRQMIINWEDNILASEKDRPFAAWFTTPPRFPSPSPDAGNAADSASDRVAAPPPPSSYSPHPPPPTAAGTAGTAATATTTSASTPAADAAATPAVPPTGVAGTDQQSLDAAPGSDNAVTAVAAAPALPASEKNAAEKDSKSCARGSPPLFRLCASCVRAIDILQVPACGGCGRQYHSNCLSSGWLARANDPTSPWQKCPLCFEPPPPPKPAPKRAGRPTGYMSAAKKAKLAKVVSSGPKTYATSGRGRRFCQTCSTANGSPLFYPVACRACPICKVPKP